MQMSRTSVLEKYIYASQSSGLATITAVRFKQRGDFFSLHRSVQSKLAHKSFWSLRDTTDQHSSAHAGRKAGLHQHLLN